MERHTVVRITPLGIDPDPTVYPVFTSVLWLTDGGDGHVYGSVFGAGGADLVSIVTMSLAPIPKPSTNVRLKPR